MYLKHEKGVYMAFPVLLHYLFYVYVYFFLNLGVMFTAR